jgi:CheY-like chemotaxis protein
MAKTILLADDSITIQKIVNLTFSGEGIDVVTVSNGDAALKKVREIHPDLVLADIFMPGENGYELCDHIKNDPEIAHIPVILLVGAYEPFDQTEATRVQADGHLTKPFEIRVLISAVNSLIEATQSAVPEPAPVEAGPDETPPVEFEEPPASEIPLDFPVGELAPDESTLEFATNSFLASSMEEPIQVEVPLEGTPPAPQTVINEVASTPVVESFEETGSPIINALEMSPRMESSTKTQAEPAIPVPPKAEELVSFTPAKEKTDQQTSEEGDLLDIYVLEIPGILNIGEAQQAADQGSLVIDLWDLPATPAVSSVSGEKVEEPVAPKAEVVTVSATPEESHATESIEETVEPIQIEPPLGSAFPPEVAPLPVAETVVPSVAPPSPTIVPPPVVVDEEALADRIAQKVIEKLSREVIERISWEVIPDLAELLIKERLDEHMKKALKN